MTSTDTIRTALHASLCDLVNNPGVAATFLSSTDPGDRLNDIVERYMDLLFNAAFGTLREDDARSLEFFEQVEFYHGDRISTGPLEDALLPISRDYLNSATGTR